MKLKVFMNLEERAFSILLISILGILWWMAIYGLLDDLMSHIKQKYRISRRVQCIFIVAFVMLVIMIHPQVLDRF